MSFIRRDKTDVRRLRTAITFSLLMFVAMLAAPALWMMNLPWVSAIGPKTHQLHALFGLFCSCALVSALASWWRRVRPTNLVTLLCGAAPFAIVFLYVSVFVEYPDLEFDYACYELAGKALVSGDNPYGTSHPYVYPPVTAQIFAFSYKALDRVATKARVRHKLSDSQIWGLVRYAYNCCQIGLIAILFLLLRRFAIDVGYSQIQATAAVSAVLLVNHALVRQIHYGQINLWIVVMIMAAILLAKKESWIAGAPLAIGIHLKLYPILLIAALLASRRIKAVAGTVAATAAVLLISTSFGTDWGVWQQWLHSLPQQEKPLEFRNASFYGFFFNIAAYGARLEPGSAHQFAAIGFTVAATASCLYFAFRALQRERLYPHAGDTPTEAGIGQHVNTFRLHSYAMDALMLALLVSPSVWEHHSLLLMPVLLWAGHAVEPNGRWAIAAAGISLFWVTTFDVFPLSYHRIAALLLLVWATRPQAVFAPAAETRDLALAAHSAA